MKAVLRITVDKIDADEIASGNKTFICCENKKGIKKGDIFVFRVVAVQGQRERIYHELMDRPYVVTYTSYENIKRGCIGFSFREYEGGDIQ